MGGVVAPTPGVPPGRPEATTPTPTTTPPAADPALAHFDSTFTDEAPGPDAGRAEVRVRAWFAPHFARVRAQVGLGAPAFSATLSRSVPWAPTGGSKSGAAFAMSGDGSLLLKSLSKAEVRSFEGLAPIYFRAVLGGEAAAARGDGGRGGKGLAQDEFGGDEGLCECVQVCVCVGGSMRRRG